jgi:hypothetical protein
VDYYRSKAAVVLAGGILAENDIIDKKYPRKDCPVCEGKGWYMSGDKIKKVDCGYCEEEPKSEFFDVQINQREEETENQLEKIDEPPLVSIEETKEKDSEIVVVQEPESKKIIIYRK